MKKEEAKKLVNKYVQLTLVNNFKFSGTVLSVNEETLVILDKFNERVSIKIDSIMFWIEKEIWNYENK